jgi:hypothetical protein
VQIIAYLLARFSEPSSYAGLGALLALAGWNIPDPLAGQLVQLLAAACGLLALGLKERGLIRAIVLIFAVAPVLAGCGAAPAAVLAGLGSAGSLYTAVDKITAATTPYIATACGEYEKGKAAADAIVATGVVPAATAAKVTSIEGFGDAACTNPPAGDPLSTAVWLGQLAGQITSLTQPTR